MKPTTKPTTFIKVSQLARALNIAPRIISDLFYKRHLDDARCPIIRRARMIPETYILEVVRALQARGHISGTKEGAKAA